MACGPSCTNCPACRGEIPHDAPAMHDLRWGMMQAWEMASSGTFWGAAQAIAVVRQGRGMRSRPVVHAAAEPRVFSGSPGTGQAMPLVLDHVAEDGSPVVPHPRFLENPLEWVNRVIREWEDLHRIKVIDNVRTHPAYLPKLKPTLFVAPGSTGKGGPGKDGEATPICCVEEFLYPEWVRPVFVKVPGGFKLGIDFHVHAKYVEGGSPSSGAEGSGSGAGAPGDGGLPAVRQVCNCTCCEFEQFVEDAEFKDGFVRDCFHVVVDPDGSATGRTTVHRPAGDFPKPPPGSVELIICPGAERVAEALPTGLNAYFGDWSGNCIWDYTDQPGVQKSSRAALAGVHYKATFLGRIVDVCNDRTVKRLEKFSVDLRVDGVPSQDPWDEGLVKGPEGGAPIVSMESPGNKYSSPPTERSK